MRVTLDLDDPTVFDITQAWHRLNSIGGKLHGRVSASGDGVHLEVRHANIPREKSVMYRRIYRDDNLRIAMDHELRDRRMNMPTQVVFEWKKAKGKGPEFSKYGNRRRERHIMYAGPWREDLDHLIADYRIGYEE